MIGERFRFTEPLSRSQPPTLFRAHDTASAQPVAVRIRPLLDGPEEAGLLRQLSHPAIPRLRAHILTADGQHIVRDYLDGISLAAELDRHRYAEAEVLSIIEDLAGTLADLHGLSPAVAHGDLQPDHILRRPGQRLALLHLGAPHNPAEEEARFGYTAPELFGAPAPTPAADVFALGAVAVALLSRRDPGTLRDHSGALRWAEHANLSDGARALLERMLDPDPGQRPGAATVRDEARALRAGNLPATTGPAEVIPGPDLSLRARLRGVLPQLLISAFVVVVTLLMMLGQWLLGG